MLRDGLMASSKIRQQRGFTLIEVLISIVILSIGLLGIAGMQATSMSNNHQAFIKTQAANMAADMADRIRANRDAAAAYANFSTVEAPADPGCINAGCPGAQLAQYDLFQWSQPFVRALQPALPGGRGFISWVDNGAGQEVVTITIVWHEPNSDDFQNNQCLDANAPAINQTADEACYQLSFRI
ncbi:MAG TPA: type IV pilus modification protein PilV [Candidatus Tenderia sp.]|nr:type IV pilus modification protein PilV [Candidatus Tenderia sp.]